MATSIYTAISIQMLKSLVRPRLITGTTRILLLTRAKIFFIITVTANKVEQYFFEQHKVEEHTANLNLAIILRYKHYYSYFSH